MNVSKNVLILNTHIYKHYPLYLFYISIISFIIYNVIFIFICVFYISFICTIFELFFISKYSLKALAIHALLHLTSE